MRSFSIAWSQRSESSSATGEERRLAGDDAGERLGSPPRSGPSKHQRLQDLPSPRPRRRRYSCRPGAAESPRVPASAGAARSHSSRATRRPSARAGGSDADRHLGLGRTAGQYSARPGQRSGQASVGVQLVPAHGTEPGGSAPGGGHLGHHRRLLATAQHHIRSGAEMPSRPRAPAIVCMVSRAERQSRPLDPLTLCPDHLAVAIEAVEVGGDRGRVGADPVRSTALGGLAHLGGELEQALDQLTLGGLERRSRGGRTGARCDQPRLGPGFAQDAGDASVGVLHVVDRVVVGLAAGQLEVEVNGGVVTAPEHEPARGVDADVVEQLVEARRSRRCASTSGLARRLRRCGRGA